MGGRVPVAWLIAVAVIMGSVGSVALSPASAQISVPLPGSDSKPKVFQRKRYVPPTAPHRNPDRVAGISAEATASSRKLTDPEAASAAGMLSTASAALEVAVKAETDDSAPAETAALSTNDDANAAANDETNTPKAAEDSASEEPATEMEAADTASPDADPASETESASEPQDADEASAPAETASDSDADDAAEETEAALDEAVEPEKPEAAETETSPSDETETADVESTEPSDAKSADAKEVDQAPEPVDVAEAPAGDSASDEPAEADEADASSPDEADTAAADAEPAETEVVEAEEATEAAPEPIETAAVEPEPAKESEPAEPATTATIDPDEPETEADPKAAATHEHDASVVLEVSPPPASEEIVVAAVSPTDEETSADDDAPKATEEQTSSDDDAPKGMAALTPPSEPEPAAESASEDEAPAASETKPDADDDDEETPAAADTKPSADDAEDAAATEDAPDSESSEVAETPSSDAAATAEGEETAEEAVVEPPPPPAHPTVATVRSQLSDPDLGKSVAASDLKALNAFYGSHEGPPLWVTEEGFTPQAQAIIAEIEKADEWGLDAGSFELPPPNDLLATPNAHADDELQLSIAILSYARDAQIGRMSPKKASSLFDQHPKLRDPQTVLTELAAASDPSAYLASLHPQHEQFKRLRAALARARATAEATGRNPRNDPEVQRILINMERWRWMPRNLGAFHVWNNIPEFNARAIKNGKVIYSEKTIVGELKYATPFFSAPMRNIVFHPNWTVPPTIVKEDLAPKLEQGGGGGFFGGGGPAAALRRHGLSVSLGGQPVDANSIDWRNENIHRYTFTQAPGPANVLGTLKFNFPNKHAIYMHDTIEPELFGRTVRTLSHGCIRVHEPDRFAALLLGEDKGWSYGQVRGLLARNETSVISLNRHIPVHLTYFTVIVDENGNLSTFNDAYGIDNRMAASLFKNPAKFHVPAPPPEVANTGPRPRGGQRRRGGGGLDSIISGLFGN